MEYKRLYLGTGDLLDEGVFRHIEDGIDNSYNKVLEQDEYDTLEEKNANTLYIIIEENELKKLYIGNFLIAQKDDNGYFPYKFPIIF